MNKRNLIFISKLLGIFLLSVAAAYFTNQSHYSIDLSAEKKHTLTKDSVDILQQVDFTVEVYVQVPETNSSQKRAVSEFFARYQQQNPLINLHFLTPESDFEWLQKYGDIKPHQVLLKRNQHVEITKELSEKAIASALIRLIREQEDFVALLQGHGERSIFNTNEEGYSALYQLGQQHGVNLQELNLSKITQIPSNTKAAIIASPKQAYFPHEAAIIRDYIAAGGNLIWLIDQSADLHGLGALADDFSLETLPGTIVDTKTQLIGLDNPAFLLSANYPPHAMTDSIQSATTVFPFSTGLLINDTEWKTMPLLQTDENTWTETGEIAGEIAYTPEDDEQQGPINFGYTLERSIDEANQRIIVIGDADFISNQFITSGANALLGQNLLTWITGADQLMAIRVPQPEDTQLNLSMTYQICLFIAFLLLLPLFFGAIGMLRYFKNRSS